MLNMFASGWCLALAMTTAMDGGSGVAVAMLFLLAAMNIVLVLIK